MKYDLIWMLDIRQDGNVRWPRMKWDEIRFKLVNLLGKDLFQGWVREGVKCWDWKIAPDVCFDGDLVDGLETTCGLWMTTHRSRTRSHIKYIPLALIWLRFSAVMCYGSHVTCYSRTQNWHRSNQKTILKHNVIIITKTSTEFVHICIV